MIADENESFPQPLKISRTFQRTIPAAAWLGIATAHDRRHRGTCPNNQSSGPPANQRKQQRRPPPTRSRGPCRRAMLRTKQAEAPLRSASSAAQRAVMRPALPSSRQKRACRKTAKPSIAAGKAGETLQLPAAAPDDFPPRSQAPVWERRCGAKFQFAWRVWTVGGSRDEAGTSQTKSFPSRSLGRRDTGY
jgi:hypothetical protein